VRQEKPELGVAQIEAALIGLGGECLAKAHPQEDRAPVEDLPTRADAVEHELIVLGILVHHRQHEKLAGECGLHQRRLARLSAFVRAHLGLGRGGEAEQQAQGHVVALHHQNPTKLLKYS
jgi:hypothetical protein